MSRQQLDSRFYYEPMMSGHPTDQADIGIDILGHHLDTPIWVSSMTGGTAIAKDINSNLARACGEYGMGMGLGSCRALLDSDERLADFDVKHLMANQPLYANLGIAQIIQLQEANKISQITDLIQKLSADGLIIHVNPLQEWLQPEGDIYYEAPITVVKRVIDSLPDLRIIVKEVGQGMGPRSLAALYALPIQAVDFAAGGGTNFAKLELHRASEEERNIYEGLAHVGHDAATMVQLVNEANLTQSQSGCTETIISGGVMDYLDGYYLTNLLEGKAIYGQASAFLRPAMAGYGKLQEHVEAQIRGLQIAHQMLSIKTIK